MNTGESKRILIAEDQSLFREGLKALLATEAGYTVVGEAEDGIEAIRMAVDLKPDVILMDLSMPKMNGTEALREIKRRQPKVGILVLTVADSERLIAESVRAGADGYAMKNINRDELVGAIRAVSDGKPYVCHGISTDLVERFLSEGYEASSIDSLTRRERQVLKMIAEGFKNREIAAELSISIKTVENHRANLMRKLSLRSTAELTTYALEQGLVELSPR